MRIAGAALVAFVPLVIILVGPWPTVFSDRRAVRRPIERAVAAISAETWSASPGAQVEPADVTDRFATARAAAAELTR